MKHYHTLRNLQRDPDAYASRKDAEVMAKWRHGAAGGVSSPCKCGAPVNL